MQELISKNKKQIKSYLWMLLIAVVMITIFSLTTSPLYPDYVKGHGSYVSSQHTILSIGLTQGLVPYKDLFGTSGSIVYFVEAFLWILLGRNGLFVLEVINLSIALYFIYQISTKYLNKVSTYLSLIVSLLIFVATVKSGNTIEEFSITLMLAFIYLKDNKNYLLKGFMLGIFVSLSWLYALPFVLFQIYDLIKTKNGKETLKFLGGILIVILPILIYCLLTDSLYSLFEGYFIYHVSNIIFDFNIRLLARKLIKCVPLLIYLLLTIKDKSYKETVFGIFVLFILLIKPYDWDSYAINLVFIPFIFKPSNKVLTYTNTIIIVLVFSTTLVPYVKTVTDTIINKDYLKDNQFIVENVTEYNKNEELIVVDADPSIYLVTNRLPQYRFFMDQSKICQLNHFEYVLDGIQSYTLKDELDFMITKGSGFLFPEYGHLGLYYLDEIGVYGKLALYNEE